MPREIRKTALVLDGNQPAALSIVRSLGSQGITVDVGEPGEMPLASLSRYSRSSFIYPDPIESPDAFVEFLHDRVQKKSYDIVIPVTENTVQPLAKERRKFESVTVLAVAKDEALDVVFNKQKTFALAAELDVPIPQTRTLKMSF